MGEGRRSQIGKKLGAGGGWVFHLGLPQRLALSPSRPALGAAAPDLRVTREVVEGKRQEGKEVSQPAQGLFAHQQPRQEVMLELGSIQRK